MILVNGDEQKLGFVINHKGVDYVAVEEECQSSNSGCIGCAGDNKVNVCLWFPSGCDGSSLSKPYIWKKESASE